MRRLLLAASQPPPPLLLLLLAIPAVSVMGSSCAGVDLHLKAADVCDGPRSIVLSEAKLVVNFDDVLPSAACNLSILVPATLRLFGRLRYLAVRVFRPTPLELEEISRRRGLCLEVGFRLRAVASPPPPGSEDEPPAQPLREHRVCLSSTESLNSKWLYEELPSPSEVNNGTAAGLLAEFSWRLAYNGVPPAQADAKPLRLALSVVPLYDCTGARNLGTFVHCGATSGDLCVPKRLACCAPVVSYLECPKRAQFTNSILDCAFYNYDVGFYLFMVALGSCAVTAVMLCLVVRPILDAVRERAAKSE